MASALCAKGSDGLDQLRLLINNSFEKLVQTVCSFGGQVIAFAGDALVCVFLQSSFVGKNRCCYQASKCALHISKIQIKDICMHVAVSYGRMSFSFLGGHQDQYTYIVNGDNMDELGGCLDRALAQEVVVTQDVYNEVSNEVTGVPFPSGGFVKVNGYKSRTFESPTHSRSWQTSSTSPYSTSEALSENIEDGGLTVGMSTRRALGCVPVPVLEAVLSNTLSGLAEIRTVTTLFLRLDSYNSETFSNVHTLQPFFLAMQKCLHECGGLLRQFLIDDKGCVLIGLWGVPTATHAANCSKALRCAVLMKNESLAQLHTVSIGITTGSVFCGVVGPVCRRDYVAVGKSVNLAARLMCKANGRILMDDETFERLPLSVASGTYLSEPLHMKGVPDDMQYHCYMRSVPPASYVRDIRNGSLIVIEGYIRRMLRSLDFNWNSDRNETVSDAESKIQRHDHCSHLKEISSPSGDNENCFSNVILIHGTVGSGKTATASYFIRHMLAKLGGNPVDMRLKYLSSCVFVPLTVADDAPYAVVRKVVDMLALFHGHINLREKKEFIWKTTNSVFSNNYFEYAVSVVSDALELELTAHSITDRHPQIRPGNSFGEEHFSEYAILAKLLHRMLVEGTGVPILCLDDAHFMCSHSWGVFSKLCSLASSSLIILTIRVTGRKQVTLEVENFSQRRNLESPESRLDEKKSCSRTVYIHDQRLEVVPVRHLAEYLAFSEFVPKKNILTLKPLTKKSVEKIFKSESGLRVPDRTIETVIEVTEGCPFLLWKLRQYVEHSDRDIGNTILRLKDNSWIACLMDDLTSAESVVLKTSSIIGEYFSFHVLATVLPQSIIPHLHSCLDVLGEKGFLLAVTTGFYCFTSSLIRRNVYILVPQSDAGLVHARVADALRAIHPTEWPCYEICICHHYSKSPLLSHKSQSYYWACVIAEQYLSRKEVSGAIPYLKLAIRKSTRWGGLSKVATIVTRAVKLAKQCAGAVSSDDDIGPLPPILDATLLELDSMLDIVQRRARIWHLLTSMSDVCRIFFQRINCNNKVGLDPEMF
eukprot:CAMPEP_0185043088 /NCGR_PEP_ID=MMETSP1103-20130426/42713_1 /TAXON_ID=36769 /ORGANISM="Paraphysomonas bandaiensis, Strain Caron Lab Isolate" /LENGTH=1044 /DNA_ID=CAMNT_0027583231 /DNA_START=441 /DNA_END=3575 /DNA_ORIENTATION=-